MKITIRSDSDNADFKALVKLLDLELAKRDGDDHSFYAQYNKIDKIKHVVLFYENGSPIACGAIKEFGPDTMEIKRMYTITEFRGKGIASIVLREMETWATEMGYKRCILETGKKQPEAISLYFKNGYQPISNYGQYAGIENRVGVEKNLSR